MGPLKPGERIADVAMQYSTGGGAYTIGFNTMLPRSAWSGVSAVPMLAAEAGDGWAVGGGLGG